MFAGHHLDLPDASMYHGSFTGQVEKRRVETVTLSGRWPAEASEEENRSLPAQVDPHVPRSQCAVSVFATQRRVPHFGTSSKAQPSPSGGGAIAGAHVRERAQPLHESNPQVGFPLLS